MIVDLSSFYFAHLVEKRRSNLLLILLTLVVDDVVEAELVDTLGGGDDAQPVTELLLLEELLGPVEQFTLVSILSLFTVFWRGGGGTYRYLR